MAFSSEPPRPTDAVNAAFFPPCQCQTKGSAASESEGSPSKNTASNFQEMKSFGDAICLSIAHVAPAQRKRGEILPLGLISGIICRDGWKQELNILCRGDVYLLWLHENFYFCAVKRLSVASVNKLSLAEPLAINIVCGFHTPDYSRQ